uniref:Butyrophilin subfamily 1 member A1-like n=1 Tax=Acanthochromis polyacanthus TaxID=80966 RepID=A0A3Q1F4M1_9TELE
CLVFCRKSYSKIHFPTECITVLCESQLIGPPRPIAALVGDDIILPCHLEPAVDVVSMTLEWTKFDTNSIFVHVWRSQQDVKHTQDKSYKGRTSLFTDELKMGNISLKLSNVKPSDRGTYKCFIPVLKKASFVELVVGKVELLISGENTDQFVTTLGDDIILPCHLEPAEDLTEMTLEWSRPDLEPRFVYVWRSGLELESKKHKTFQGRTMLFTEELQHGNISLRLNRVTPSDNGTYSCYIPTLEKQTNVHLDILFYSVLVKLWVVLHLLITADSGSLIFNFSLHLFSSFPCGAMMKTQSQPLSPELRKLSLEPCSCSQSDWKSMYSV